MRSSPRPPPGSLRAPRRLAVGVERAEWAKTRPGFSYRREPGGPGRAAPRAPFAYKELSAARVLIPALVASEVRSAVQRARRPWLWVGFALLKKRGPGGRGERGREVQASGSCGDSVAPSAPPKKPPPRSQSVWTSTRME